MKKSLLCTLLLLLLGCSQNKERVIDQQLIEIDLSKTTSSEKFSEIVYDVDLIQLETNNDVLIHEYSKVIVKDKHIFILDSKQNTIFIFDDKGKFIRSINRTGQSGQEYITADDLLVNDNQITVFDNSKSMILLYDLSGVFQKSIQVCNGDAIALIDSCYFVYNGSRDFYLTKFDQNGTQLNQFIETNPSTRDAPSYFSNNNPITNTGHSLLISNYFDYSIYSLENDVCTPKYTFNFGADNVNFKELHTYSSPNEYMKNIISCKGVTNIDYFSETDSWITFQVKGIPVYYNQKSKEYYIPSKLELPFIPFLDTPVCNDDKGNYYILFSASNVINDLVPFADEYTSKYDYMKKAVELSSNIDDNHFIVSYKLRD